jgi:predicted DCC family thiol-disulfide oxidoreductase YuxK
MDRADLIHFAPLGGETATRHSVASASHADTVIVIRLLDHQQFEKSAAALQCLRAVGGMHSCAAALLSCIPVMLRDRLYDLIARRRHTLFPPHQVCDIPDSRLQKKLLP